MKIKALYQGEVVYIIGFCTGSGTVNAPREKAIISRPFVASKAMIEAVYLYELYIIDDEYNPYYEELQE